MKNFGIKKIISNILLYVMIFIAVYHYTYSYAFINFDIKKNKAIHGLAYGQIYYSNENNKFYPENMSAFLHWWGFHKKFQHFSLPIQKKHITSIRLDPLSDKGEVIVKNVEIVMNNGFDILKKKIDLNSINQKFASHLKIIKKDKNELHLVATGKDPHLVIANNLHLTFHKLRDVYQLIKIAIITLFFYIIMYFIIIGFINKKLRGEELLTAIILIVYSVYTVLFGTQFKIAWLLIENLPILAILIMLKQGFKNYLQGIRNILLILLIMIIIIKIIDIVYGINTFHKYSFAIKNSIYSMIIALSFIQKNRFNYIFYKYFLYGLSILIGITTVVLHYEIIRIDTTIAFGYTMAVSDWAQKNYSFWYIILLFGAISFFDIKTNKKDLILVCLLFLISAWSIFTGYSESAKLAYIVGLILYMLFSIFKAKPIVLNAIPLLIGLYILFFPWISDIYVFLSHINYRLEGRAPMFAIYSDLIKHSLIFGYGFNNTSEVHTINIVSQDIVNRYKDNDFLHMCAPHSLPLLLWINFGIIGMLPFSILLYTSVKKVINRTLSLFNQPALIALMAAFMVVITFSWGTWQPHALLTFTFFVGMILLSLNINYIKDKI